MIIKKNTSWLSVKSGVSEAIFKNMKQGIFPKKNFYIHSNVRNNGIEEN